MAGIESYVGESVGVRSGTRRLVLLILAIVVGLHILIGVVAGLVVVAQYILPSPATFEVKKDVRLPARKREHKMNMAAFDSMAPQPTFNDKMLSRQPTAFALPELPEVPLDQMLPLDPAALVSDQVSSLVGAAGLGGGAGGNGGLDGLGAGFSFLGVQSNGRRILLLFDVSRSVATKAEASGMPLTKIRDEAETLVGKLPPTSRFNIIQFTQNYQVFRPELVPASRTNREEVSQWLQSQWVESGTMSSASKKVTANPRGLVGVLELATQMTPDVIFLISDGDFQWRVDGSISDIPWEEVREAVGGLATGRGKAVVHFVGFSMKDEDRREMARVVRSTGGRLRKID